MQSISDLPDSPPPANLELKEQKPILPNGFTEILTFEKPPQGKVIAGQGIPANINISGYSENTEKRYLIKQIRALEPKLVGRYVVRPESLTRDEAEQYRAWLFANRVVFTLSPRET